MIGKMYLKSGKRFLALEKRVSITGRIGVTAASSSEFDEAFV